MIAYSERCLQDDVDALLCCAPLGCQHEYSCYRVAKFVGDVLREKREVAAGNGSDRSVNESYESLGNWESA